MKKIKKSFTLIETIVVLGVISVVLPALFAIFFIILKQQVRIYALTEVKRQGDFINTTLENVIRNNAYKIFDSTGASQYCGETGLFPKNNVNIPPTGSYFVDRYGSKSTFSFSANTINLIPSNAPTPAPTLPVPTGSLNNSNVKVSSFTLNCSRTNLYSAPVITANYAICYKGSQANCISAGEENVSLNYTTVIKLRNFPTQ